MGIWCKILQARNAEEAKTRAAALATSLKLEIVILEGDCKVVKEYLLDQTCQVTWEAMQFLEETTLLIPLLPYFDATWIP